MTPRVVFFGSFQQYSDLILTQLLARSLVEVIAVVTTPPQPMGRDKVLTKNSVHSVADSHQLPVLTPETLTDEVLALLMKDQPDYFVTAGYGKLLPASWLAAPKLAALNLHFSLLPKFRGANPAEWALLLGETTTGVTLIEMSPEFDTGTMIGQATCPIQPTDTRETLYHHLYLLGGEVLAPMIATYHSFRTGEPLISNSSSAATSQITYTLPPIAQPASPTPYAKRLRREDGFLPWSTLQQVMAGQVADAATVSANLQVALDFLHQPVTASFVERAARALAGFPSLWTMVLTTKGKKRMKILDCHVQGQQLVLDSIQIEGKQAVRWNNIKNTL